ncbi:MAG TPA: DUF4236 domain-containing protein [Hyphomicrobiaceae bacterium]|nr:DUF4236 domain-containing protein [Hyphomicrobiaceae bacterium]
MAFLRGFRFRKSIGVAPGLRINLSKSGVSTSVGGKGATVNVGMGRRPTINLGIPGTGLSYRAPVSLTLVVILLAIAAIVGIAWLIQPQLVQQALHWWQPKWF